MSFRLTWRTEKSMRDENTTPPSAADSREIQGPDELRSSTAIPKEDDSTIDLAQLAGGVNGRFGSLFEQKAQANEYLLFGLDGERRRLRAGTLEHFHQLYFRCAANSSIST